MPIRTLPGLAKGLKDNFEIRNPNTYFDKTMSLLSGKVTLDIMALDDWLHKQHGDYEDDLGLSMSDFIIKQYGSKANTFVKEYM